VADGAVERILDPDALDGLEQRPTAEIRELRGAAEEAEEGVSYARRLLQGRLDILRAELLRRQETGDHTAGELLGRLPEILAGDQGHAGPLQARSTRLRVPPSAERHTSEIDAILDDATLTRVTEMDADELVAVIDRLGAKEHELSAMRRRLFDVIDRLRDELAERYKDGRASVSELLGGS
jgi:hypothetical protein